MNLNLILIIYGCLTGLVYIATGFSSAEGDGPDEIDSFFDWLCYAPLFPILLFKHLILFLIIPLTQEVAEQM